MGGGGGGLTEFASSSKQSPGSFNVCAGSATWAFFSLAAQKAQPLSLELIISTSILGRATKMCTRYQIRTGNTDLAGFTFLGFEVILTRPKIMGTLR